MDKQLTNTIQTKPKKTNTKQNQINPIQINHTKNKHQNKHPLNKTNQTPKPKPNPTQNLINRQAETQKHNSNNK